MGYLDNAVVQALLAQVLLLSEVQQAVRKYHDAASAAGIRVRDIDMKFVGAVYYEDGASEALLSEDRRVRAANPELYQLVYLTDAGLDVDTFDTMDEAKTKLDSLKDAFGELGGVIVHDGKLVSERLQLKYLQKSDFEEYLQRAIQPPVSTQPPTQEALLEAVKDTLLARLEKLTKLSPKIGELKKRYEKREQDGPEVIHGKPSEALNEFAHLYPSLVRLGGCVLPSKSSEKRLLSEDPAQNHEPILE